MESTKVLTVVAVVAVVVALFGVVVTFATVDDVLKFAGKATTETGTGTVTVLGVANLNFSRNLVNWSTGSVNVSGSTPCGGAYSVLDTEGTVLCATSPGWQVQNAGLVLDNIGNSNITVNLTSSNNAAGFIGGTGPIYNWKLSNNETGSCNASLNPTIYQAVSTAPITICTNFGNVNGYPSSNQMEIDLNITIPATSPPATKTSVITATGIVNS